jgi:hypothetical protein
MSRFRSSVPAVRGRIDTRPQSDPAVAAGMRNIHRDTDGTVLSGTTAEGQRINAGGRTLLGSPIRPSRLDGGVKTPMLDAMPRLQATNPGSSSFFQTSDLGNGVTARTLTGEGLLAKANRERMQKGKLPVGVAGRDAPVMGTDTNDGGFYNTNQNTGVAQNLPSYTGGAAGKTQNLPADKGLQRSNTILLSAQSTPKSINRADRRAENLQGRQSLFRDMKTVGRGGVTPKMRARAAALGVDSAGFQRGMNKLADAPASIARPSSQFRTAPAGVAPRAVAQQPLQGADKARADMAKYGTTGAAERFLAANPAKDAEARIAKRNTAAATAKAELDAVDPRYNAPTLAKSPDASVPKSKFRSYLASKGVIAYTR